MLDELVGWREEKMYERSGLHFANSFLFLSSKKNANFPCPAVCRPCQWDGTYQLSLSKSVKSSWLSILAAPLRPQVQRISRVIYTLVSSYLDTTFATHFCQKVFLSPTPISVSFSSSSSS